ncbi:dTDP-4-dehydrorhamnose 3,5-epimerase family protein [Kitasatospora sp. NPDC001261]|uniref:dTDP-4-dehydrorhamnose 3,5-epimerase family protein n=1 Tax=Kitasatospora sp. NPDC001261 TaxID=3364012 RepID=UPI0036C6546A
MDVRELAVEGALEFTPRVFPDDRGEFLSGYQEADFRAATGRTLFAVRQASHSRSRSGVLRGVHYTATPPGCEKYVTCPRGRALDVVVDLRVGSPTFGRWDSVELGPDRYRAVYLPVGVGHLFLALEDDTVVSYLLSQEYVPRNELALSPFDPALALPVPEASRTLLSARDRDAPSLAEARSAGLLPDYRECRRAGSAGR